MVTVVVLSEYIRAVIEYTPLHTLQRAFAGKNFEISEISVKISGFHGRFQEDFKISLEISDEAYEISASGGPLGSVCPSVRLLPRFLPSRATNRYNSDASGSALHGLMHPLLFSIGRFSLKCRVQKLWRENQVNKPVYLDLIRLLSVGLSPLC